MSEFFLEGSSDEAYNDVRDEINEEATLFKQTIQSAWDNNEIVINDQNFRSNAQNNFWGAVWHLFLLQNLREGGYNLVRTGDGQPDIRIDLDGRTVWVEAVSVTPGEGLNRVAPPEDVVYEPEWDKILLRLTSGLEAKRRAFATYIENGVVNSGDACVIALNSVAVQDSDFWRNDMDSEIRTVLFGMGNLVTHFNIATLEPIKEEFVFKPTFKKASTNAEVNNCFFRVENNSQDISGVIFSPKRPFYAGEAHLHWIHNPWTRRPITQGLLRVGVENWMTDRTLNTHQWWPRVS